MPVAGDNMDALILPIPAGQDTFELWTRARDVCRSLNRYPVVVPEDLLVLGIERRTVESADTILRLLSEDSPDLANHPRLTSLPSIDFELHATEALFGAAPSTSEVHDALGQDPGRFTLDRWLFDWEQRTGISPAIGEDFSRWHPWSRSDHPTLVLLPTPHPWDVPRFLPFEGGSEGTRLERLLISLRRWENDWDIQIVNHFGTVLNLQIDQPLSSLGDAWQVAWEQIAVAASTARTVPVRHYARTLINHDRWVLHEHP